MASLVIDASVTSTWCFKDEATDYTNAALDSVSGSVTAIAPRLWLYEVHNSTLIGVCWQRITQSDAEEFLQLLSDLSIQVSDSLSYRNVFALAQQQSLTVYDAAYLELAIREAVPLATLDKALCKTAANVGVSLFKP